MKISTEIGSAACIAGEEKAVEYVARAGFDAWDFSMFSMCDLSEGWTEALPSKHPLCSGDYLKFARKLKKIGEDNGICCNQSHAPFPSAIKNMEPYLKRAIECTAEAGGRICVVHPDNDKSPEENAEMYAALLEFAKHYDVKIATENMYNWDRERKKALFAACATAESFNAHLAAVNDDRFVACLDIGHAEMMGDAASAEQMIYALGDKLQALHIHDNDRRNDSHQIPFSMSIDFEAVVGALKKIDYKGYFTLEADSYIGQCEESELLGRLIDLKNSVRRLADMFEA